MGRTIRNGWGLRSQIEEIRSQKKEGEERGTIKENVQFLIYARGLAGNLERKYILDQKSDILKMIWQVTGFRKLKKFLQ